MIQQPGNTDLSTEPINGQYMASFAEIFDNLAVYHKKLGYPVIDCDLKKKVEQHREFCLAIHSETTELTDAIPWKPWRPIGYKPVDEVNVAEEVSDIIFFLGSVIELWGIKPEFLAQVFERKLIENNRRISIGYSKPAEEMGK